MEQRNDKRAAWLTTITKLCLERLRTISQDLTGVSRVADIEDDFALDFNMLAPDSVHDIMMLLLNDKSNNAMALFGAMSAVSSNARAVMQSERLWRAIAMHTLTFLPISLTDTAQSSKADMETRKSINVFYKTMLDHYQGFLMSSAAQKDVGVGERWRLWKRLVENFERISHNLFPGGRRDVTRSIKYLNEFVVRNIDFGNKQRRETINISDNMNTNEQYASLFSCPECPYMFGYSDNRIHVLGGRIRNKDDAVSRALISDDIPGSNWSSVCCAVAYPKQVNDITGDSQYTNVIITTSRDGQMNGHRFNNRLAIVRFTGDMAHNEQVRVDFVDNILLLNEHIHNVAASRRYLWILTFKQILVLGVQHPVSMLYTAEYNEETGRYENLVDRYQGDLEHQDFRILYTTPIIIDPHHEGTIALTVGPGIKNTDRVYRPLVLCINKENYTNPLIVYRPKILTDVRRITENDRTLVGGGGLFIEIVRTPSFTIHRSYVAVYSFREILDMEISTPTPLYIPLTIEKEYFKNNYLTMLYSFIDTKCLVIVPVIEHVEGMGRNTNIYPPSISKTLTVFDLTNADLYTSDFDSNGNDFQQDHPKECHIKVDYDPQNAMERMHERGFFGTCLPGKMNRRAINFHNGTLYVAGSVNMLVASAAKHEWAPEGSAEHLLSSSAISPVRGVSCAFRFRD